MKSQIRVIKTQGEYEGAMSRLSSLMDLDPVSGSDDEAELELLALVIEAYESKIVPAVLADPIEAILLRVEQLGMTKKDLVPMLGSASKVSEVLGRKRQLSLSMIRALHKGLDIPAEILISAAGDDAPDITVEPVHDYSRFPFKEMFSRGYFKPSFKGTLAQARELKEELVTEFLRGGVNERAYALRAPLHQEGAREMDEKALLVWRVAAIKKARAMRLKRPFLRESITGEWLRDLARLSRFETGPRLAQEYLADSGVALVIVEHFPKTYLDGAAMLDEDIAIVALTLRHDRIDNFWFALMHELVHIKKHLTPEFGFIADNLDDKTRSGDMEEDADAGAREALISATDWDDSEVRETKNAEDAIKLAAQLRIHPAIVAGRVRYENKNFRLLNSLIGKSGDVSGCFADQLGDAVMHAS